MKQTTLIVGILLLLLGLATLGYEGYSTFSTKQNTTIALGGENSAGTKTTIPLRPIAGGLSLICGFILIVVSNKKTASS